ncbi:MAG: hypothetical protein HY738_08805 [Bacteroidia bacterium]|nr:hypothetical protein [Bacteroidia bacterium]
MLKNVRLITKLIIPLALYFNSFTVLSQTKDEFYEDGTLKGRGEYSNYTYMNPKIGSINHPKTKFKKKTGEWTYWYRDGALMRTESYLDEKKGYDLANIPDGSWKYYDHEETLIKEEIYREGRLIGLEVFAQGIIDEKSVSFLPILPFMGKLCLSAQMQNHL